MPMEPELARALRARLDYFRDLGVFDLYRRAGESGYATLPQTTLVEAPVAPPIEPRNEDSSTGLAPSPPLHLQVASGQASGQVAPGVTAAMAAPEELPAASEDSTIARRQTPLVMPEPFVPGAATPPAARARALEAIRADIGDCTRCQLAFEGRHTIVFGDGDPNARLLFVGEGPGADEDASGVPFIGKAGQLLNNMINAMGLKREQVYIANIVKCRPPANRVPEPQEAHTCTQFLFRQLDVVRPEIIVALGSTAATYLLGVKKPLSALRKQLHQAHGSKLIVTYHPAYLLRDPTQKKEAWMDLQLAMRELGIAK